MRNCITPTPSGRAALDQTVSRLIAEVTDGLRHGYFEISLTCEIVNHQRRQFTLRAGKSYQFLIPKEDCLLSSTPMVIPDTGTPARKPDEPRCIVDMTSARQARTAAGLGLLVAHGERS